MSGGKGAVMTTLDAVTKKTKTEPTGEAVAAKELVRLAKEQGLALDGPNGLLGQFTKTFLETALNEEMTEHLGHEKNRAPDERDDTNVRNGTHPKTVISRYCQVERATPAIANARRCEPVVRVSAATSSFSSVRNWSDRMSSGCARALPRSSRARAR